MISQIPFLAENFNYDGIVDSYEANLRFPNDGKQGHYYVERYDQSEDGRVHIKYVTKSNSLEVECSNIKVLNIYCWEMYEKKSEEVFKRDPNLNNNYYKTYFIERDYFYVHVYSKLEIEEIGFIDTPTPYNVSVNGREWWLTGINYSFNNDGIVLTNVPSGHNYVDIYFDPNDNFSPQARFTVSKNVVGIGESITFNASKSTDTDGDIISYVWDFGDGLFKGGETIDYSFHDEGIYNAILTVTDDDYLIGRAYKEITVVKRIMEIAKSVNKPIATPGGLLNYTISLSINSTWTEGLKEIVVTDTLPDELNYVSSSPLPQLIDNELIWHLGIAFETVELPEIKLQTIINENVKNKTIISNFASLDYQGINNQNFPQEISNIVTTKVNLDTILAPGIRTPVPNIELFEDAPPYNLYLSPFEYDFHDNGQNLKWYISDKNESLYIISGEYSDNDIITITPLSNKYGNSLVTLWLVDSEGYTAYQPLWINITPVNDKPIFSSAPDLILHYNEPFTFNYEPYVFDIDTPEEYLQLFVLENDGTEDFDSITDESNNNDHFMTNGLKVTYNFPEDYLDKKIYISLVIFDGEGSDGDTIQINVTDDYTPRLSKELPDVHLHEGETKKNIFDIDDYFEDPDQDSLFYSYGETHIFVNINENHSVDITAPNDWNGVDTVTFRARDPIGAIAEDTIEVTVSPINDPPSISGIPDTFIVHYDYDYIFDLTPYISDEDNETEELFLILTDNHIRTDPLNNLKIIINYPKSMFGLEIPVRLTVSDGIDKDYQDTLVKISESWPPEIKHELPDVSFFEDEIAQNAFNLNDYFSDKDSNALYYTYGQKNVNININIDGIVDFLASPNWFGVEIVTFRATDPVNAFVESVILVTVNPVNDPPIFKSLPKQYGIANQLWKFDLTEYISDIDNDISELEIRVKTNNIDINVKGRELLIYSNTRVVENITITVKDGISETSQNLLIEIREDDVKPPLEVNNEIYLLWIILIAIIILFLISGFTYWRKYNGRYNVEEIFCIGNNGILISHVASKKSKHAGDEQLVSGMLTAILAFTQDAFSEEEGNTKEWGIKEIQMNEKNILVERGNYIFLATVFSGTSGKKLYSKSRKMISNLENKYRPIFKKWDGNITKLKSTSKFLETMLPSN